MEDEIFMTFFKTIFLFSKIIVILELQGVTLIPIAVKVYNVLTCRCIQHEVERILRKINMAFGEINTQPYRFWLFVESSKAFVQRIPRQYCCCIDSIQWGKMDKILLVYIFHKKTIIVMLYINKKAMVCSLDDTNVARLAQRDTLAL